MPNDPHPNENDPALDLDLSRMTPEICAALIRAQRSVKAVEFDGVNTQLGNKRYASGEAMIRAARPVLEANNLALISTFRAERTETPRGDIGNQFVCATVVETFALIHESGGAICGSASMDAIGSRARPNDKAVAATCTYMHGYLLRHLLHMPRGGIDEGLDVDSRQEGDFTPPQGQTRSTKKASKPRAKSEDNKLSGLRRAVAERMGELFARDPKWDAIATTEGEAKARGMLFESLDVPRTGRLGADHLRTVNVFLKERLSVLEDDGQDEPPPYEPDDGKGGEVPEGEGA